MKFHSQNLGIMTFCWTYLQCTMVGKNRNLHGIIAFDLLKKGKKKDESADASGMLLLCQKIQNIFFDIE